MLVCWLESEVCFFSRGERGGLVRACGLRRMLCLRSNDEMTSGGHFYIRGKFSLGARADGEGATLHGVRF